MSKLPPPEYLELCRLSKRIHLYTSILHLLHWDQETYMPSGANAVRSEQIAELSRLIHEEKSGRAFKNRLAKLVHLKTGKPKLPALSKSMRINVREWHHDFRRAAKLPASFVENFSQVTSEASQIWATARKENNFKLFAPFLEKIVTLACKKAELLGFEEHPYDALLILYEPCMTSAKLERLFKGLKKELISLVKKIGKERQIDDRFLHKKVAEEKQLSLARYLLAKLPLESAYTRLDLSVHPFSVAMHPHDSRITTRAIAKEFMSSLLSTLHEAGHSLYEMGLPLKHWGTPLAEASSLSLHESQSRWWETLIGRSLPFWRHFYPFLQKELPHLKKISLERFYRAINRVSSSPIRVESDEVTYCLHIIARFELEKELISGSLHVNDLPEAWNSKMRELLRICPSTDAEGCLQDIHWSLGEFGYFPTYALGNLFSAQLFTAFAKEHPDWPMRVEEGELEFIRDFLKEKIHRWGRTYNLEEFAKKLTGTPLTESAYCSYLKKKYSDIYRF